MSWQDTVTGAFAAMLGVMILSNCVTMYRDKMVRGVNWFASAFVGVYSFWNVYYFAQLDQWFPSLCSVVTAAANTLWISMMFYYLRADYKKHEAINARYEAMQAEEQAERDAWMNEEEAKFYARQTWSPRHDATDPLCNCASCH